MVAPRRVVVGGHRRSMRCRRAASSRAGTEGLGRSDGAPAGAGGDRSRAGPSRRSTCEVVGKTGRGVRHGPVSSDSGERRWQPPDLEMARKGGPRVWHRCGYHRYCRRHAADRCQSRGPYQDLRQRALRLGIPRHKQKLQPALVPHGRLRKRLQGARISRTAARWPEVLASAGCLGRSTVTVSPSISRYALCSEPPRSLPPIMVRKPLRFMTP